MPFLQIKNFLFMPKLVKKSLMFLVLLVNQNWNQKIVEKLVKSVHGWSNSTNLEISKIQLGCQGSWQKPYSPWNTLLV